MSKLQRRQGCRRSQATPWFGLRRRRGTRKLAGMRVENICGLSVGLALCVAAQTGLGGANVNLELAAMTVTPHVRAQGLRYAGEPNDELGARVELFMRNPAPATEGTNATFFCNTVRLDDQEPQRWIQQGAWAWHDTPAIWPEEEASVPPGAMVVWRFNTKATAWGLGKKFALTVTDWQHVKRVELPLQLAPQGVWLSAVTFLSSDGNSLPDTLIFHVANQAALPVRILSGRLYLPPTNAQWRVLFPQPTWKSIEMFPADGVIPAGDKGGGRVRTGRLPLAYAALELTLADRQGKQFPLWSYQRIKRETFDLGAGWVQDPALGLKALSQVAYLKTLKRLHVTTAHIGAVPGYTDQLGADGLYTRYPLKLCGNLTPVSQYESDAMLPFVHALDILGKPQSEPGGLPRFPQAVEQVLVNYAQSRLPAAMTLSDESSWRLYAGLSDYPSLEAFRVGCPAPDGWPLYDRWEGNRLGWGAPLETLGELARSLRELNRPRPIAAWSQGPRVGGEVLDGRRRTAPTPDEIRLQACQLLASRVTSLYWADLGLRGLVQFRDTLTELTRLGREIRMLEELYLTGDAYRSRRMTRDGKPDWDLASITTPNAALLFALDLDYTPDRSARVFEFKHRRETVFVFDLPAYLRHPPEVFRLDADGLYAVNFSETDTGVQIADKQSKVAIYVATPAPELRRVLDAKRQSLIAEEEALNFDPANKNRDFDLLRAGLGGK